jgi:hypothetical protein
MVIPDPGSRVKKFPGSRIRIRIKEFKYFNKKNCFQSLGNMIQNILPGSGSATLQYFLTESFILLLSNHSKKALSFAHNQYETTQKVSLECGLSSLLSFFFGNDKRSYNAFLSANFSSLSLSLPVSPRPFMRRPSLRGLSLARPRVHGHQSISEPSLSEWSLWS